jgi:Zn-dependent protease with chaperone function
MPYKKKFPRSRAVYFMVMISVSFVLIVLEGFYLNPQISAFLIPLTVATFAGVGAYLGSKRHYGKSGTESDGIDGRVRGAFKDDDLSKEYSKEAQRLLEKDIEVYRQLYDNPSKTWSPAFSIPDKTPRVVLSETFFFRLNSGEKRALMIHEICHYVHSDMTVTYRLALLFVLSVGGMFITMVHGVLYGMDDLIDMVIISFFVVSISLIGILKLHLIWQEYRADKCAASDMGEKDDIKAVIKKASEYARVHTKEEKYKRIEVQLMRRLRHLGP